MQASQNGHAGFARPQRRPRQRLVYDGRRPASLRNHDRLTHSSPPSLPQTAVTAVVMLTRAQTSVSTIPAVPLRLSRRDSGILHPNFPGREWRLTPGLGGCSHSRTLLAKRKCAYEWVEALPPASDHRTAFSSGIAMAHPAVFARIIT
jgi:hypothetical protein